MSIRSCNTAIVGSSILISRRSDGVRKSALQMQVEAGIAAMKEAGIGREQVGALFTGRSPTSYFVPQFNMRVMNELKLCPSFTSEITSHGAGALGSLEYAAMAIESGAIDYALCTTGDASGAWMDSKSNITMNAAGEADPQFERPYGPSTPSLYAIVAQRYLYESGNTRAHMAKVAVENRKWALHHPDAVMYRKGPITVEEVLNSPVIASPLHLLDCAPWFPGGIATAVVLTRSDLAREHHPAPIYLAGVGQCITHEWITDRLELSGVGPSKARRNMTHTGAAVAAKRAYDMAGLKNADADLAQSSAPFTFFSLMMLEELGYCGPGEAGAFVDGGGIDYEGGRPYNTSGGYLSFGQSAQGLYLLLETIQQLRGHALGRQVLGAKIGLVHGHGGPMAAHTVVLVSSDQLN